MKDVVVIGGPNGAGKTTAASQLLPTELDCRGRDMKELTTDQLVEIIDRSLKKTAEDVRLGRVPLDGRARMPIPHEKQTEANATVPDAAE